MNNNIRAVIHYLATHMNLEGPIIELGSKQESGQIGFADLRPYFPGRKYIGYDAVRGPGVDRVGDIQTMPDMEGDFAGTILCLETLEHCTQPLIVMRQIWRCIRDDGLVVISTQHYAPEHPGTGYGDYWRFTRQGVKDVLLHDFGKKMVLYQGDPHLPITLVGFAVKNRVATLPGIDIKALNSLLPWPYPFPFEVY